MLNNFADNSHRTERLLREYVACPSIVNTESEKCAEDFIMGYIGELAYFREHPELCGRYKIPGDALGRSVCWALVRSSEEKPHTLVMIHHMDVVDVEDFKLLSGLAFSSAELERELINIAHTLHEEAREDLLSGEYMFGRGVCDMKAGGVIQLEALRRYSELPRPCGNLLLIAVPDEENLSAGMRGAVELLGRIKDEHSLDYRLMINSEPHQRSANAPAVGIFSKGSVGKLMPLIYARGYLSHAGKVYEGFNPLGVLANIVQKTEASMEFSERSGERTLSPPTWLCLRDGKTAYDVSLPLSAYGCLSILTMRNQPGELLERLKRLCDEAFCEFIAGLNAGYEKFEPGARLPWQPKTVYFKELFDSAWEKHGEEFLAAYGDKLSELIGSGLSMIDITHTVVEFVYGYIDDLSPTVVIALTPPFYHGVTTDCDGLEDALADFAKSNFGQAYISEEYFTGISDLSFCSDARLEDAVADNMPMLGRGYDIPDTRKISMPCINIGPWGKDFHKLTERVLKEDVFIRTPALVNEAIKIVLEGNYELHY